MANRKIVIDQQRHMIYIRHVGSVAMISAIKKALHPHGISYDPGFGFRIHFEQLPLLRNAAQAWGLSDEERSLLDEAAQMTVDTESKQPLVRARPCRTRPWQIEIVINRDRLNDESSNKVVAAVDGSFTSKNKSQPPAREFFEDKKEGVYGWRLRGTLSEYYRMLISMESRGVDGSQIRSIIEDMGSRGIISEGRQEGELDGFEKFEEFKNNIPEFESRFFAGKNVPVAQKKLAPQQEKGIAFLYGNSSALLGDDVGVGKTVQMIIAAELRRRQTRGSVIFITQPILIQQMKDEILKITGIEERDISSDFRSAAPYRVLSYNLFGTPSTREVATAFLRDQAKNGMIKVLVLDEVHNVKNGNPTARDETGGLKHKESHQTFNIQEFSQYVPFVWGASATVIGNTPTDIYNELKAVNHPLGKMPYEEFKRRFDPSDADLAKKLYFADELKERLIHSGVYLQRSKEQLRPDMPQLVIGSAVVNANPADMPENATKQRESIAVAKAPFTIEKMMEVIRAGKKAAAFTSFKAPLKQISEGLRAQMQAQGVVGRVATIEGDQPDRKEIIQQFRNPASDFMAIVISTPAGGTGLDFPNILTDVFVNDFDWSVAKDEQALGRFHRLNSQEPVHVTYMVSTGIDEANFNRLNIKKQVADELRQLDQVEVDLLHAGIDGSDERVKAIRAERLKLHEALDSLDRVS